MATIKLTFRENTYPKTAKAKESLQNFARITAKVDLSKTTFTWNDENWSVTISGEGIESKHVESVKNIPDATYRRFLTCFEGKFEVIE